MTVFHPDLAAGRFIPKFSWGPTALKLMGRATIPGSQPVAGVSIRELRVPGPVDGPEVLLRIVQPTGLTRPGPALLWIHGGGMITGAPQQDDRTNIRFALELGITVVAVRYRLAPDSPAPAAVEDAYAGLLGLVAHAAELRVDVDRIALGGASAGGGLAAAVALVAHDRGVVHPAFQLLVYPMLDDRTTTRRDMDTRNVRVWTPRSNRFGWHAYLGDAIGGPDVTAYSAPARREDLAGLPPAWIGVGSLDLFHDEDVVYADRLRAAGVPCDLEIVPGAFHGFDALFPKAGVSNEFWEQQARALRAALSLA